jgi:AsmA protein
MKILARILTALFVLLVLALVSLVYYAPRLIERPEVKERIAAAARDATGRELRYEKLDVGLLPPRLVVEQVRLEGDPRARPLGAERVELEVALLPLLARTVLVDTLVVSGAEVSLARTAKGIELPIELPEAEAKPEPEVKAGEPAEAEGPGVSVAVRQVRIERSAVTLVDRTVKPAAEWQLADVNARARGRLTEDLPIAIDLAAKLGAAPLHVDGEVTPGGKLDLKLALAHFALAALAPYLPPPLTLAGEADVELELAGEAERFAGPLALDLSAAEITRGESFRKPRGERAALTGRVVRDGDAFRLEDGKLALRDVEIALAVETAPRLRARLDAPRFALEGFGEWLPGLAEAGASGGVALEQVEVRTQPLEVRGGIVLDRVGAPVGETRGLLTGRLEGQGNALAGENLELRLAEQLFRIGLRLDDLAREPRARLRLASEQGADAGKLVSGLSGKPSTLEGPLALTGDVNAPLSDPDALLRALSGNLALNVTPGRLRGVSLLRSAFDALGSAGRAAELLGGGKRERLERFQKDAFETLAGSFQIADGRARTEDLRLVYSDYQVDLRGVLGLVDRSLDFTGRLTLFEELDQALAEGTSAGTPARGVKRELPLAAVKGTLDSPRVVISPAVALQFAAAYYGGGERREKLERKIEEKLGEGSGKQMIDLLDSVLGAGRRVREEEQ